MMRLEGDIYSLCSLFKLCDAASQMNLKLFKFQSA